VAKLWDQVERLIERAPSPAALHAHGLHLMAARLWHAQGRPVPDAFREERRRSGLVALAAPVLLRQARDAYDGQLMLMKGPEVACRYPDQVDRYFHDLDLLAEDPVAAQRALIAAGFVEFGHPPAYDGAQHLCPLLWPGLPLIVEIHRRPNTPWWLPALSGTECLRHSVPSATGVEGLLAPDPAAHALLLAAHSWAHRPLGRLGDLVDVAAILGQRNRPRASELAHEWHWEEMWRATLGAGDALLTGGPEPLSLRIWARHLLPARDRTVLEEHLSRLAAPACTVPPVRAPIAVASAIARTAARREDERWTYKLRRTGFTLAHALTEKSKHEWSLSRYEKATQKER
jgi:hypothetical protein